ncbi:hypothetical protein O181_102567 [Austropuccinia psidii MF-1]|uniref:Uncharacterized protein n=1 Tax=Austropuccinia psidii MF-1 TaxID=1389203 RepID=A0A9Q3PJL3_9BASI|nr:hypothetical protein [Austropuccinia psidii MF-1]
MPSTRSGTRYNPSRSSQKAHRYDYGRRQSVSEVQGSVYDSHSIKVVHSEADNTVLPSNRSDTATRSLSGYIQRQPEGLKNALQHKEYQILADLWKNCMKSYLTLRKCLGHPNTCKLINGWHPFMEKNNMMLLTAEWRKQNPIPLKQVPRTSLVARSSDSNVTQQPQAWNKGKGKEPAKKPLQSGLQNPKDSAGFHGKLISDGKNNYLITEKG